MSGKSGSLQIETPTQKRASSRIPVPANTSTPKTGSNGGTVTDYGCEPASEFGNLNTRFATIVERNRTSIQENAELKETLSHKDAIHTAELTRVKDKYDNELAEARRLLDKSANEKVALDIENQNIKDQNKELEEKAKKSDLNSKTATDLAEQLQAKLDQNGASLAAVKRDAQNLKSEKEELRMQLISAKSDLDKANKERDAAKLGEHEARNQLQSKVEEFDMKFRILTDELANANKKASESLTRSLADQSSVHSATMASALEEIREEHEQSLAAKEDGIQKRYEKKVSDLERKLQKQKDGEKSKAGELSQLKASNNNMANQLKRAEKDLSGVREELRRAEAKNASQKGMADSEIEGLHSENNDLKQKNGELEEKIKIGTEKYSSLTNELQTYRKLLEVEEERHNLTPSPIRHRDTKKRTRSQAGSLSQAQTPPKRAKKSPDTTVEDVGQDGTNGQGDSSCRIM
jgi:lamin B